MVPSVRHRGIDRSQVSRSMRCPPEAQLSMNRPGFAARIPSHNAVEALDVADLGNAGPFGVGRVQDGPHNAVVDRVVDAQTVDAVLLDGRVEVARDLFARLGNGQVEHAAVAHAVGWWDEYPLRMLYRHERSGADALGLEPK